jgi:hypothetical protein
MRHVSWPEAARPPWYVAASLTGATAPDHGFLCFIEHCRRRHHPRRPRCTVRRVRTGAPSAGSESVECTSTSRLDCRACRTTTRTRHRLRHRLREVLGGCRLSARCVSRRYTSDGSSRPRPRWESVSLRDRPVVRDLSGPASPPVGDRCSTRSGEARWARGGVRTYLSSRLRA